MQSEAFKCAASLHFPHKLFSKVFNIFVLIIPAVVAHGESKWWVKNSRTRELSRCELPHFEDAKADSTV